MDIDKSRLLRAAFFVSSGIFTLVTMKSAQGISLKYIVILFFALLGNFYIFFLSSFDIPEKIPFTPVKTNGLIVFSIFMVAIIFLIKELIKLRPDFTVSNLTLYGVTVCLITEVFFQGFLWRIFPENTFHTFIIAVTKTSITFSIPTFFTAFQLKTHNTPKLVMFIVILIAVTNILGYIFPTLLPNK